MKHAIIIVILLLAILIAGLIITRWRSSGPAFDNLNQAMQFYVSDLVKKDKSVRNCVVSVRKGDGSFSWSGAAGVANQNSGTPMTKDTPIYIASITKLYTAAVVMRLHEKNFLSLDDPMSKYLPDKLIGGIHVYEGKDYSRDITIRQLLSQTSGIADYYSEKGQDGKSLFELFLEEPDRSWTVDETIERARKDLKPHFPPGTGASYSDTNFQLLGKIIEAATGKPLHVVYEELIFRPLDLKHTWLIGRSESLAPSVAAPADAFHKDRIVSNLRSNGSYWADGGLVSTTEEMILFLKALNEGRIISKESLDLMHHWHKIRFPLQYGYGTMYFSLPRFMNRVMKLPPLWGHSGSTASFLYYSEDLNLYMAGTINQTQSMSKPFRLMIKIMKTVQTNDRFKL
ncbi:MAG: beta-lactamase family protein [Deltaproteobacteria bacterium]|nr:beta-lactamase family protein [Deltaproteobacteria bacterium]